MNTPAAPLDLPRAALARSRKRRRRFLAAASGGLAILGASLGVSFLGPSGTTSVSVSAGGSSNLVFPVAASEVIPSEVTSLKYTTSGITTVSGGTGSAGYNATTQPVSSDCTTLAGATGVCSKIGSSPTLPNWSAQIASGSAGTVDSTSPDTPGDLALVDATQVPNAAILNMYVTNLAGLQQDYSSFTFHVNIYSSPCTSNSCSWTQASGVVGSSGTYITNTSGFLSFSLPKGYYYDITIDTGGSFYTVSTSTSNGATLSPSYYFTAQSS